MNTLNAKQSVELFHLLFLAQLGRKLDKKLYALKGGCNMRFYFQGIRYSEDMDIGVQIIAKDTLKRKVQLILDSTPFRHILKAKGLEILTISSLKQTETTQRFKISLKSSSSILPLQTKIEFSRRSFSDPMCYEAINSSLLSEYALPLIMINHYSLQSMYEQKIKALALRNETQARDVFDIYYLIKSNKNLKPNKNLSSYLKKAQENALGISFTDFKGQVVAYLAHDDQAYYDDKSIWKNIVSMVLESLDI